MAILKPNALYRVFFSAAQQWSDGAIRADIAQAYVIKTIELQVVRIRVYVCEEWAPVYAFHFNIFKHNVFKTRCFASVISITIADDWDDHAYSNRRIDNFQIFE